MVVTPMKATNEMLLGQLGDFDHDVIFGHAANSGHWNVIVKDGTTDLEFIVIISGSFPTNNDKAVNIQNVGKIFQQYPW